MWESSASSAKTQGGFLNTTVDAASTEKKKGDGRLQNLVPLCIRQLLESSEVLTVGSVPVHVFTMVVLIRRIQVQSTKVIYVFDDGTGNITGIFWLDTTEDDKPSILPDVMENMYCRIFGSLKNSQGKKHVFVYRISKLTSLNDLTKHILEVSLFPKKLAQQATKESVKARATKPATSDTSMSNSFMSSGPDAGFTPPQMLVYNAILKNTDDVGAHKDELVKTLAGQMTARDVTRIVDFLSNEGHIYSTIDDDHYRCTDN